MVQFLCDQKKISFDLFFIIILDIFYVIYRVLRNIKDKSIIYIQSTNQFVIKNITLISLILILLLLLYLYIVHNVNVMYYIYHIVIFPFKSILKVFNFFNIFKSNPFNFNFFDWFKKKEEKQEQKKEEKKEEKQEQKKQEKQKKSVIKFYNSIKYKSKKKSHKKIINTIKNCKTNLLNKRQNEIHKPEISTEELENIIEELEITNQALQITNKESEIIIKQLRSTIDETRAEFKATLIFLTNDYEAKLKSSQEDIDKLSAALYQQSELRYNYTQNSMENMTEQDVEIIFKNISDELGPASLSIRTKFAKLKVELEQYFEQKMADLEQELNDKILYNKTVSDSLVKQINSEFEQAIKKKDDEIAARIQSFERMYSSFESQVDQAKQIISINEQYIDELEQKLSRYQKK